MRPLNGFAPGMLVGALIISGSVILGKLTNSPCIVPPPGYVELADLSAKHTINFSARINRMLEHTGESPIRFEKVEIYTSILGNRGILIEGCHAEMLEMPLIMYGLGQ